MSAISLGLNSASIERDHIDGTFDAGAPMKVLVVSQHFWPESIRINDIVRALGECGSEVTVLTGQPNYPDGKVFPGYSARKLSVERWQQADIFRVPLAPRGKASSFRLTINYLSFIAFGALLGPWLLRKHKFDVVLVYASSPLLQALVAVAISWLKNCPLVIWVQDLWPETLVSTGRVTNPEIISVVGRLVSWIYSKTDLILVQSPDFIEPVAALAKGKKIEVLHNPADAASALQNDDVASNPIANLGDKFDVVFAGNLGTAQSLDTIVEAAELLRDQKDIRIFLIGSGSREPWLRAEIVTRSISNIVLPGRFDPSAMPAIFSKASALLLTLQNQSNYNKTIPSKLQAYLAAGRPIVASANGATARVVSSANAGLCCEAESPRLLADIIVELRDATPENRLLMGQSGRTYFEENFEPTRLCVQLLAHFRRTVTD